MNATVHEQEKKLHLSWKERVSVFRSNRYVMMLLPFFALALIVVIFGIWTEGRFFRLSVLKGVLSQAIIIGTCATGVAFIYANGNLDISIGAVLGLAATFGALAYNATSSAMTMIIACVAVAMGLMLFNCTMSVICHINTITVAIVVNQIYNAFTTILIGGAGKIDINPEVSSMLEGGGFRMAAAAVFFVVCVLLFHYTKIGRALRFLGGNERCAEQTGMSNAKITYVSFLVTGIGIGLAAVFSLINVSAVSFETGNGLGMDVMLATVLGGMSIFGGARSNSYAGFLGAITVAALNKGLLMVGVSSATTQGIRGVIFLLLVYLNSERQNLLPSRVQF